MLNPLDYSLCRQTVTVYRLDDQKITRQVYPNAFYTYQVRQVWDGLENRQDRAFTLILPGQSCLMPGDRIYDGVGPEVSLENWPDFLPVTVPGLSQVQYVQPCYWQGVLCHTLAGRK